MPTEGIVSVIKALPTSKLIETVSGAIGKAYEPRHIRKMADAKAYEINIISKALRENSDIIATYNDGKVAETLPEYEDFKKRTMQRLAFQEFRKQKNIESVADFAYEELEKETTVSDEPVDQDWVSKFFNCVEEIGNEEMQQLWGKVLAGEVKQPGSFSFRTLDVLKNMSQNEARLFEKVASLVSRSGNNYFLTTENEILNKNGVFYGNVLSLADCGLLIETGLITQNIRLNDSEAKALVFNDFILLIKTVNVKTKELSLSASPLTQAGVELYKLISAKTNKQFVFDYAEKIFSNEGKKDITISVHEVNSINGNNYNYKLDPIKQWG